MAHEYRILCDAELIGTSALESRDPGMGIAYGQFVPTAGYERIKDVFRLFADAQRDTTPSDHRKIEEYYRARDRLVLTVETHDGKVIPTSVIHIADFRHEIDESACEVEIHLSDPEFFGVAG